MGLLQENIGVMMPLIVERFARQTVAASLTSVQLNTVATDATSGTLAVTQMTMPFAGSICAIALATSAAAGAGQLSVVPTVNGTAVGASALTTTITTAQKAYTTTESGLINFNAGDQVGVQVTTNGAWNGTTADLLVELYVMLVDARF